MSTSMRLLYQKGLLCGKEMMREKGDRVTGAIRTVETADYNRIDAAAYSATHC